MNDAAAVRVYSALLLLYPRRFRRDYGQDMALMFAQQVRDEGTLRASARAATDLALTIPARYLEVPMKSSTTQFLPVLFGGVATAAVVSALLTGSSLALTVGGLIVALVFGGLALISHRRNQPVAPSSKPNTWWKLAATGCALLAAVIVTVNITGTLGDGWWLPMMITGLGSMLMIATGAILGVIRLVPGAGRRAG